MTNNITQAAANKAAEEGGLPAEDDRLHSLIVEVLSKHRMVRMFEVEENGFGNSYPLIDRLCLDNGADVESGQVEVDALAWAIADKIAADRAARPVANKAMKSSSNLTCPSDDPAVSIGSTQFFAMLINYGIDPDLSKRLEIVNVIDAHIDNLLANKAEVEPVGQIVNEPGRRENAIWYNGVPAHGTKLYATPPATTGASTARDQALEEAARVVLSRCIGFAHDDADLHEQAAAIRALKGSVDASTVLTDEKAAYESWVRKEMRFPDHFKISPRAAVSLSAWEGWQARSKVSAKAGQVAVPAGWTVKQDGDGVHIEDSNERWCVYERNTPAHRLTCEFFEDLIAAAPSPAKE
jgi:hypothetical protein